MNASIAVLGILRVWRGALFAGMSVLPLIAAAQFEAGMWKSTTQGIGAELPVFFPKPTAASGSPEIKVVPLLSSNLQLLPGGWLLVWVGRTDGTPLANASVTIRVPAAGNALVGNGARVVELTVQTDVNGVASVRLAAPDVPSDDDGGGQPPASE